jgi:hypothetical protein
MNLRDRIRTSVSDIKGHGQRLVKLNADLLKVEMQKRAQQYGAAVGLFVGAALLALYAFGFALVTVTVALALVLPLWLALLIVTLVLFIIVAVLALVGRSQLQKAKTPAPDAAVSEARASVGAVRTGASQLAMRIRSGAAAKDQSPHNGAMPASPPAAGWSSSASAPDQPSAATGPPSVPPTLPGGEARPARPSAPGEAAPPPPRAAPGKTGCPADTHPSLLRMRPDLVLRRARVSFAVNSQRNAML